jgi:hypothetical protein
MSEKHTLFKHSFSGAADGLVDWTVDPENKIVDITMQTAGGQKPFLSSAWLEDLIYRSLKAEGIVAYHDDDVPSWTPLQSSWKVFVNLGELRLRAVCWHHRKEASGRESPMTIELYPAPVLPITVRN